MQDTIDAHFSALKYSKYNYCWQWELEWERMGIQMFGKMEMGMRYWTLLDIDGCGKEWDESFRKSGRELEQ